MTAAALNAWNRISAFVAERRTFFAVIGIVAVSLVTLSMLLSIASLVLGSDIIRTDLPASLSTAVVALGIAAAGVFMLELGLGVSLRRIETYQDAYEKARPYVERFRAYALPRFRALRTRFSKG